jgi:hypothetical protein
LRRRKVVPNGLFRARILAIGVILLSAANVHAAIGVAPRPSGQAEQRLLHTAKSVIDKSCLRMCDQWGEHGCLKWVTRCKGDPGYPKPENKAY